MCFNADKEAPCGYAENMSVMITAIQLCVTNRESSNTCLKAPTHTNSYQFPISNFIHEAYGMHCLMVTYTTPEQSLSSQLCEAGT